MSQDVTASIKARLLIQAKQAEVEFQLYLVRYACERFLYRLGVSRYRERCCLKGAGLLALWMPDPYRGTRDLEFLASGPNDETSVRELMSTVCAVACPEDGLSFDLDTLEVMQIRAEEEYEGKRARVTARLGKARIRFQVDFGFGGTVTPTPEERDYPTLLPEIPAPRIRAYPREVSIAEKFEAMVSLGRRNSRMKDFHDIWALSSVFAFWGPVLREAVTSCFDRRETRWEDEPPDVLCPAFYENRELQATWSGYLGSSAFMNPPPTAFETIGDRVRGFLGPVRECIVADHTPFQMHWPVGGPWRPGTEPGDGTGAVV
ncbi:MAG: nucleotidyl transferase AbiEii/AbiGii toxin family protein [Planctomycetota bacterium]